MAEDVVDHLGGKAQPGEDLARASVQSVTVELVVSALDLAEPIDEERLRDLATAAGR